MSLHDMALEIEADALGIIGFNEGLVQVEGLFQYNDGFITFTYIPKQLALVVRVQAAAAAGGGGGPQPPLMGVRSINHHQSSKGIICYHCSPSVYSFHTLFSQTSLNLGSMAMARS